jgi:hypothetical protein
MSAVVALHENKENPRDSAPAKIVEAYGLRKCPKLVEQCQSEDIVVRTNALMVLCDEFLNPKSIYECCKVGVIRVLANMITHSDYLCRLRSSKALALAAEDANGVASILETGAVESIIKGIRDPSQEVRANIIMCMYYTTRTADGVGTVVAAGMIPAFVEGVASEVDQLKAKMLMTIEMGSKTSTGLAACLTQGAVKVVVELLANPMEEVAAQAAKTLGFLCFSEECKEQAIESGAIAKLCGLLKERSRLLRSTCSTALMAITSTDEGKRKIAECDGALSIAPLLSDSDMVIRMNALKVIANIAVNPSQRALLLEHESCVSLIERMTSGKDARLQKHAQIALDAVRWKP